MHLRPWQYLTAVALALLASALFSSPAALGRTRSVVQIVLVPVTAPLGAAASWLGSAGSDDRRPEEVVRAENEQLRRQVAQYATQIDRLAEYEEERLRMGRPLAEMSQPAMVGTVSAGSEGLVLTLRLNSGVQVDDPVWHNGALIGRVSQVAGLAARVKPITARGEVLNVRFGRFDGTRFVNRPGQPVALEGNGDGLIVRQLRAPGGVAPVEVGDWATLDDPRDWPLEMTGVQVGRVTEVRERPDAPQVVEVRLEPAAAARPGRVMVVTR
jgi:hypothetical protein